MSRSVKHLPSRATRCHAVSRGTTQCQAPRIVRATRCHALPRATHCHAPRIVMCHALSRTTHCHATRICHVTRSATHCRAPRNLPRIGKPSSHFPPSAGDAHCRGRRTRREETERFPLPCAGAARCGRTERERKRVGTSPRRAMQLRRGPSNTTAFKCGLLTCMQRPRWCYTYLSFVRKEPFSFACGAITPTPVMPR